NHNTDPEAMSLDVLTHHGMDDMVAPSLDPTNLCDRRRQVPRRPRLVVLSVLAPEIPGPDVRHPARAGRPSSYNGVLNRRRGIYRRRVAVEWSDQTRLDREPRAQDGDAAHGSRDRA